MKKQWVVGLGLAAVLSGCGGATQDVIYVPNDPNATGGYVATDPNQPPVADGNPTPDNNPPVDTTPFVPPPQQSSVPSEDPRYFPELMKSTRSAMSTQDHGLMSAVRFLNQTTNFRMSFLVGDSEGFTPLKDDPNRYISFLTGTDGEILTLFIASTKPGHYECTSSGFAIGFSFTGEDPLADKTAWSDVGDGYCSFDLSKGPNSDDLEARFSGLITANDRQATYLIDDGYFFSRKPQRGVTRTPTPPPNTTKPHGGPYKGR